ncbi:MAG: glycogen/starch synthase, partial [Firmicutes bacterium]|nr:glycogen/starch synthase [Bacillota bacterium]
NLKFQGEMSDYVLGDILGLSDVPAAADQLRSGNGAVNFMKGGLCYSDVLTTVSPTYAEEIKSPFYGERLEDIFRRRSDILHGILNGIDTGLFDPASEKALPARFTAEDRSGKTVCKAAIQKELGLVEDPDVPLIVMVGRLTSQKGLDLVRHVLGELLTHPIELAILGTGDPEYEDMLRNYALGSGGKMSAQIRFDEALSHRMYAGADMLLMPSLFEPCGLAQMIAMRYGTLPVVRETGGLKDSVVPYNKYTGEGTGFGFAEYNAHTMMFTILAAAELYRSEPETWKRLMDNAMAQDFSWARAAREYAAIYLGLHPELA